MSIRAQEGNVTLITALTAGLMLLVILLATGIAQNSGGSTRMQASSDGAALTAASGYIMALNDDTLLDTIQWAVDAVGHLGNALEIAGAAIIAAATAAEAFSLGLASAAVAILIAFGTTLISAGSTLISIGQTMSNVVDNFVTVAKQVVDIAKYVLAIANSTIIASNNGYLGFMLPAALNAAGALKYDKTDADKIVRHAKEITSDTGTPASDGQGLYIKASLKETLRRAALRDLWTGGKQGQQRGHNTFQIWNSPTPGCNPDTWDTVGADPTNVQFDSHGVLQPAKAIKRDCSSEFKYLVQLLNRAFNAQIADLKGLRAKINLPNVFDDSQGSLQDANSEIDSTISDLQKIVGGAPQGPSQVGIGANGPQSDLFPSVPSGLSNQDWANYVYSYYHSTGRGQACKGASAATYTGANVPFTPYGDGSNDKNQTFFGCLTAESQNNPANPGSIPGAHSLGVTTTQNNQSSTTNYWWTGTQNRDVQSSDVGSPPGPAGTPCCWDFRTTDDYAKNKRFVGDTDGMLNYVKEVLRYGHTTKGGEASNPITFLAFQKLDPTYMQETTARLSGQSKPPSQYSVAATMVDVKIAADDNDRISFAQFCGKIFDGDPNDDSLLGFLPNNGAAWCTAFANLLIGAASAINSAPQPIKALLDAIFGTPPPTQVYHAEMHVPAATTEICQALNVIKEIQQGTSSVDAVWKEVTNPPQSVATSC
ncbi:MAG: hypothetical protein WAT58_07425 [Candidatus Dormiibacterota bacterium]